LSRHRDLPKRPRALEHASDAGITLIEVLVSSMLIGILMTAMTAFFVSTVSATGRQGGQQVAAQLADDATELVRALRGSAVAAGRDKTSSDSQWAGPVAGVAPYLADMQETWDTTATFPSGASAPLPTTAKYVTIDGVSYGQNWYVGRCWQPQAGGDCDATPTTGDVELFRVVVAVIWSERHCASSTCSYVTATLVSGASGEPVFNPTQPAQPATVTNPGDRLGEVAVADSLQVTATGGAPPRTWSASGLPPGLTMSSDGLIAGTPTTAGTYSVTARVTDGFGLVGSAAFSWTINPLPQLANPGSQTTILGTAVSLPVSLSGGTGPMAWSVAKPGPWGASGLPPGLSIDTSTGVISGTPTTAGPAADVTVTVVDSFGNSASETFTWTVTAPPPTVGITFPADGGTYTSTSWDAGCGSRICGTAAATGSGVAVVSASIRQGSGNYWNGSAFASASEVLLPATGTTSWSLAFAGGNFPATGSYTVRAVVTDTAGGTASTSSSFTIDNVAPAPTALTLHNANGAVTPRTDEARITFSEPLDTSSVCSAWSGTGDQTLGGGGVVVTITNNGADDVLTVTAGACTLHIGSIATGNDYVSATSTFSGTGTNESRVTWTASTRMLTIHIGRQASGALRSGLATGTAVYTPDAAIADGSGNRVVTTPFSSSGQRF
jgi:type II secretory pathway pseudopilin PulG